MKVSGFNMNIKPLMQKLFWAVINTKKPNIPHINLTANSEARKNDLLFILIDYDKFANREFKQVGRIKYRCGRLSLNRIHEYCLKEKHDFIKVVTTDNHIDESIKPKVNGTFYVFNEGTDVSALRKIRDTINQYESVIVANSSSALIDTNNIERLTKIAIQKRGQLYIAGFNANSRISPRLPFSRSKYPHIITNYFATGSRELLQVIASEEENKMFNRGYSFGNKYFSIRYFEVLLSALIVHNGGNLILLGENDLTFPADRKFWPKEDSRLTRFADMNN